MQLRSTINISITRKLEDFIESRVRTGRYQTASEVVRDGLRLLQDRERQRDLAYRALRVKLRRAAAQADRGELADPDRVLRKIERIKRQRHGGGQ
jgi:antitoxin ParD1/3/4